MVSKRENFSKDGLNKKLDKILQNQKKILEREEFILRKENKIEDLEKKELREEEITIKDEEMALEELKKLRDSIRSSKSKVMRNITLRDVFKGGIGAFVGVISHLTFTKAAIIAPELSFVRATLLYLLSILILLIMLYYSGFRKIKKHIVMRFIPLRALLLFLVSILIIIFVNLIFGKIYIPIDLFYLYQLISANIILAVIGAATADLIGRAE